MVRTIQSLQVTRSTVKCIALALASLSLLTWPAAAQPFKAEAMQAYDQIVSRREQLENLKMVLPEAFPLGEGALVAYFEEGELLGIIVQYSGARSGDWQEFYYRDRQPFFVFSKFYDRNENVLYRHRFYFDDSRQLQAWEVNDIPQIVRSGEAILASSRIIEDSRQLSQLVTTTREARAKPAAPVQQSIVDALDSRENSPEIPRALPADGSAPPAVEDAAAVAEKQPEPNETPDEGTAATAPAETPILPNQVDEPVNPEVLRWAAWANATRDNKEEVTPFPAELVLGKIEIPPLPQPPPAELQDADAPTVEPEQLDAKP